MRESSEEWYSYFWRRDRRGSWVHGSMQGTKGPFVSTPVGSWRKPAWRTWVLHGPEQLPGLEKKWTTTRQRFLAGSLGAPQLPCALKRRDRRRLLDASKERSRRSLRAPRSSTHQQSAPHTLGSISRKKGRGAFTLPLPVPSPLPPLNWNYSFSYWIGQNYKSDWGSFSFPLPWPGLFGKIKVSKRFEISDVSSWPIQGLATFTGEAAGNALR